MSVNTTRQHATPLTALAARYRKEASVIVGLWIMLTPTAGIMNTLPEMNMSRDREENGRRSNVVIAEERPAHIREKHTLDTIDEDTV